MLRHALHLIPDLKLALECTVCLKHYDTRQSDDDATTVALFGAATPYAQCPACRRIAGPATESDPDYRRRVRIWLYEHGPDDVARAAIRHP